MNRSDDLISVLTEDHRELRQLLTELDHLTVAEPLWRSLTDLMIAEMVRHSVAEECYLYPVARDCLPKGQGHQTLQQYVAEHEKVEQMGKRLERHDLTGEELTLLLSRLNIDVRTHMRAEEEELFPLLAEHLSREDLAVLGRKAAEAKEKAAIRQRPSGRPLLNTILASETGLVERVRDYLRGRAYPL